MAWCSCGWDPRLGRRGQMRLAGSSQGAYGPPGHAMPCAGLRHGDVFRPSGPSTSSLGRMQAFPVSRGWRASVGGEARRSGFARERPLHRNERSSASQKRLRSRESLLPRFGFQLSRGNFSMAERSQQWCDARRFPSCAATSRALVAFTLDDAPGLKSDGKRPARRWRTSKNGRHRE